MEALIMRNRTMQCHECGKRREQKIVIGHRDKQGQHYETTCPHCLKTTKRIMAGYAL